MILIVPKLLVLFDSVVDGVLLYSEEAAAIVKPMTGYSAIDEATSNRRAVRKYGTILLLRFLLALVQLVGSSTAYRNKEIQSEATCDNVGPSSMVAGDCEEEAARKDTSLGNAPTVCDSISSLHSSALSDLAMYDEACTWTSGDYPVLQAILDAVVADLNSNCHSRFA